MDLQQVRDLIDQREAAATATADQLREQIAVLTERLRLVETEVADLTTTRHTLTVLAGAPEGDDLDAVDEPAVQEPAVQEPTGSGPTYTQIMDTFTSGDGMRAKDICRALSLDTSPKNTEGIRAKLKRLVTRGSLREDHPGLFTFAS